MTDASGDEVADLQEGAGQAGRPDDDSATDLPGVGGGDVDPVDGGDTAAPGTGDRGQGLGDADDVEAGAGAVEPPD